MNKNSVIEVAEELYRRANPATRMDTPSYVYEKIERANKRRLAANSDLSLYDWCMKELSEVNLSNRNLHEELLRMGITSAQCRQILDWTATLPIRILEGIENTKVSISQGVVTIEKNKSNLIDKSGIESEIFPVLSKLGFTKSPSDEFVYLNEFCSIQIQEQGYAICDNEGATFYTEDFVIYTVIGYLLSSGYAQWVS